MKGGIPGVDEELLITRFTACLPQPIDERSALKRFRDVFLLVCPGETPFGRTADTTWVPAWVANANSQWSAATTRTRLFAFARLSGWLFAEGVTDADVFAHVDVQGLLAGTEHPLDLRYNLQRLIQRFMPTLVDVHKDQGYIRGVLLSFNAFLNRQLKDPIAPAGGLRLEGSLVCRWIAARGCGRSLKTLYWEAGLLHRCLQFGVQDGAIVSNGLHDLLEAHGARGFCGIVEASLAVDTSGALAALNVEPRFASAIADHIHGFIAERRALGHKYRVGETIFAHLDRFLRRLPIEEQQISPRVLDRWAADTPAIGHRAREVRERCVRQLCCYIREREPCAYVPLRPIARRGQHSRPPFIYSVEDVRRLLDAALELKPANSLRPQHYYALIALLYCAGLRVGEALKLRMSDVDLDRALLLVREAKFYKSRWIPLSPSLADCLRAYSVARTAQGRLNSAEAPFFVNRHGRENKHSIVCQTFIRLLRQTGLRGPSGERGPRLHDLRHSFAVNRLARWYREGADVQAKLPLLSTYLGHSSIFNTQIYLTATSELLREGAGRFYAWRSISSPSKDSPNAR